MPGTFSLFGAGRSTRFQDTLQGVFSFTGGAALRITPTSGQLMVTSRTYNDAPDGTYGQFIPGVSIDAAIREGQKGRLIQLAHSARNDTGFRTNIGFLNAGGSPIDLEVELYTGASEHLGTKSYDLQPYEHDQVSNIFSSVTSSSLADAYAVTRSTTSGARFFAYASVVDNRSGDPVYIPAGVSGGPDLPPDPPPFAAPTLTVTAVSASQIDLSWTAVPLATKYRVYRGSQAIYDGPMLRMSDIGLSANTEYCYTAVGYNSGGEGVVSTRKCASTGGGVNEITITLQGGVTMDLVHIPAGTFGMGSPANERGRAENEDLHQVTLSQGYYIGKTEVTQGQWEAVMGSNPASGYGVGRDYPV